MRADLEYCDNKTSSSAHQIHTNTKTRIIKAIMEKEMDQTSEENTPEDCASDNQKRNLLSPPDHANKSKEAITDAEMNTYLINRRNRRLRKEMSMLMSRNDDLNESLDKL